MRQDIALYRQHWHRPEAEEKPMRIELDSTVDKRDLLEKVRQNRDKHVTDVGKMRAAYKAEVVKQLEQRAEDIKTGAIKLKQSHWTHFDIEYPVSYEEVYDQVIEILSWTKDEEIELSAEQFRNWVMDRWDWSSRVAGTKAVYASMGYEID